LPDGGKVLHKRSGRQGTQTVNTKMDHPSWEPCIPRKVAQGYVVLYSVMGWDDSSHKVMFPRLPAIIRRPMQGQHSPSMSPHTGGSVGTKLSRSRWQHNRKAFWAPVVEGPRYKDDRRTASPGTRRLYFSMGADMSCNQTREGNFIIVRGPRTTYKRAPTLQVEARDPDPFHMWTIGALRTPLVPPISSITNHWTNGYYLYKRGLNKAKFLVFLITRPTHN
jgi:hypothetical protein